MPKSEIREIHKKPDSIYEAYSVNGRVHNGTMTLFFNAVPDKNDWKAFTKKQLETKLEDYEVGQQTGWSDFQSNLEIYEVLHRKYGDEMLIEMGRNLPYTVPENPNVQTPIDAIEQLNTAHQSGTKGVKGGYDAKPLTQKDNAINIISDTVYPCPMEVGVMEGVVEKYGKPEATVEPLPSSCRIEGSDSCFYEINW